MGKYVRTGRPAGRPTNRERAERERLAGVRAPQFGPPVPRGLGWGGSRPGAGRPKRVGPAPSASLVLNVAASLAARLSGLTPETKNQYIRKALELMIDISPPESFQNKNQEPQSGE